jgi:hypothetical protein
MALNQWAKRQIKPPQYLNEYELGKKLHSKTNDKEVLNLLMKESNRSIATFVIIKLQ